MELILKHFRSTQLLLIDTVYTLTLKEYQLKCHLDFGLNLLILLPFFYFFKYNLYTGETPLTPLKQNKTKQNKTKQIKTKQNQIKTKQNKSSQNIIIKIS